MAGKYRDIMVTNFKLPRRTETAFFVHNFHSTDSPERGFDVDLSMQRSHHRSQYIYQTHHNIFVLLSLAADRP